MRLRLLILTLIFFALPAVGQGLKGDARAPRSGVETPKGQQPEGEQIHGEQERTPFFGEGTEKDPADTVKKKRQHIPLESYHFDMEQRSRHNMMWTVDMLSNNLQIGQIDTLQADFQNSYTFMKRSVGSAYLGNLGAPSLWLNFFDRPNGRDHSFADAWGAYLRTPADMPFYHTKRALSQVSYIWAGMKQYQEEDFSAWIAHNVTPSTGFNLNYRTQGTKGIYNWQGARNKTFSVGVNHTGRRWMVHAGYIHNQVYNQENGGVTADTIITIHLNDYEQMRTIPTRMSGTRNTVRSNTFFLHQSLGIPFIGTTDADFTIADRPAVFVGHSVEYSRWWRRYEDTYEKAMYNDPSGQHPPMYYYDDWHYNGAASRDSLFEGKLSNRAFVQIQPWNRRGAIGTIDAGVGMDLMKYYLFDPSQLDTGAKGHLKTQRHYYAYAGAAGALSRWVDWRADFKVHPAGVRKGDTELGGELTARLFIKDRPLSVSGRVRYLSQEPSYWEQNFSSNHFVWRNSFDKENETRIEGSVAVPHIGLSATLSQSVLGKRVYYDANALPAQAAGTVNVTGVYFREDLPIRVGATSVVNLNHRVMLQRSSNQVVVPLPLASAYLSYSFEFNAVRDVLRLQVGFDGRYNTRYYAPGYNAGTGQMFNQRERQLGAYPWVDAWVSAKWKRMRILIKWQHVNDGMFGQTDMFSVLHYPMNRRVLKWGLSWNFYDD